MATHNGCGTVTKLCQHSAQETSAATENGNTADWKHRDKNVGNFQFSTLHAKTKVQNQSGARWLEINNVLFIPYRIECRMSEFSVSQCRRAGAGWWENLLGEKKENGKERCGGKKGRLWERKENYKISQKCALLLESVGVLWAHGLQEGITAQKRKIISHTPPHWTFSTKQAQLQKSSTRGQCRLKYL